MKTWITVLAVLLLTGCLGGLYQQKYDALYQRCMEVKRDSAKCEELVFEEQREDQRAFQRDFQRGWQQGVDQWYQPGGIFGPPAQSPAVNCRPTGMGGFRCTPW